MDGFHGFHQGDGGKALWVHNNPMRTCGAIKEQVAN